MSEGQGPRDDVKRPPPAGTPADAVDALESRLGVRVRDRTVALAALTHKSYVNEHKDEDGLQDNERLEFLGDAVIDLAVSHRLMERFPGAREGDLSKMRAAVVDEQGLAGMARALDLGLLLRLGRGEELTGGRQKASLLADAMEAVVAAVYLGEGLLPVLAIVDRFMGEAFARAAAGTLDRDYKTQLQELAQSRLRATPRYRVVAEHGPDHSKTFEVETDLRGEVLGRGTGRSKKDAEQGAAKLALDLLGRRFADVGAPPDAGEPPPMTPAAAAPAAPPVEAEARAEVEATEARPAAPLDDPRAGEPARASEDAPAAAKPARAPRKRVRSPSPPRAAGATRSRKAAAKPTRKRTRSKR
jgi:ribonuclease III